MNSRSLSIGFSGLIIALFAFLPMVAQELYVFTDPASTKPARSIGIKHSFPKNGWKYQ